VTVDPYPLTDDQSVALDPNIRLIEAGPGAGKTKTVVARFRNRAAMGHGVALLSFTNAAVNVAKRRCQDDPSLTEPPNFIGTFDQFFHRYVVTPDTRKLNGKSPTYLNSWSDLPDHIAALTTTSGARFYLSQFARTAADTWEVDETRLRRDELYAWAQITQWSRDNINGRGHAVIEGLINAGVLDTSEARQRALSVLGAVDNMPLKRLGRRFTEVIIDEFQDCDEIEHGLINLLTSAGIHVVVVADPDQAIYEFRQHSDGLYEQYRANLPPWEVAQLTTCHRSTPAICALSSSLRKVAHGAIVASPNHSGAINDVHVIVGAGVTAGQAALDIVRGHDIQVRNTRIIAHRRADARQLLRAGKDTPDGQSNMKSLLVPLAQLRSSSDTRERLAACRAVESFILDHFEWPADPLTRTRADQLALLAVTEIDLRVAASKILVSSRDWASASDCKASVKQHLIDFADTRSVPLISTFAQRLNVTAKVWEFWEGRTQGLFVAPAHPGIRWSHVHSVKGEEFDAVIYAIPAAPAPGQSHVLDDWTNDVNSEQRRVLYVGVSRAKHLVVLVVPKAKKKQLLDQLKSEGIPHKVAEL
jgi:DNA helicase II / ATP-dependent DNA helicase PcrA